MKKIKKDKILAGIFTAIVAGLALVFIFLPLVKEFKNDLRREAVRECIQWKNWSQDLKMFWLTPEQKKQCNSLGIKINAPVKVVKI